MGTALLGFSIASARLAYLACQLQPQLAYPACLVATPTCLPCVPSCNPTPLPKEPCHPAAPLPPPPRTGPSGRCVTAAVGAAPATVRVRVRVTKVDHCLGHFMSTRRTKFTAFICRISLEATEMRGFRPTRCHHSTATMRSSILDITLRISIAGGVIILRQQPAARHLSKAPSRRAPPPPPPYTRKSGMAGSHGSKPRTARTAAAPASTCGSPLRSGMTGQTSRPTTALAAWMPVT